MKALSIAFVVAKIGATGFEFLTIFFAVSWRPAFAAAGTIVRTAVLIALSRTKVAFIRVPLRFADLAFRADFFRHPNQLSGAAVVTATVDIGHDRGRLV